MLSTALGALSGTSEDEEDSEFEVPTSLSEEIGSISCSSEDEEDSELDVPRSAEDCTVDVKEETREFSL